MPKKIGRKNVVGPAEAKQAGGEDSKKLKAEGLKAKDLAQASAEFEQLLEHHFTQEEQKKIDEATENIFGSVLARYGWVRNEQGRVEYVGGEEAELSH